MPLNGKVIKSKIKSVKNTRKITKAMEMIAAAKMRKAVKAASESRRYTIMASEIVGKVAKSNKLDHPFTQKHESNKELMIVISSNRGLCGNFNSAISIRANRHINESKQENSELEVDIVAVGKKAVTFARKSNGNLVKAYDKMPENIEFNDVLPIITDAIGSFSSGEYGKITLAYTQFESSLVQYVKAIKLLPISADIINNFIEDKEVQNVEIEEKKNDEYDSYEDNTDSFYGDDSDDMEEEYKFEPTPKDVIDYALKRVLEAQFYQAFLESAASEHSSRMIAMKNASDAARDMIDGLTLDYNKSRQAAITQEIAEISNAAAALEE